MDYFNGVTNEQFIKFFLDELYSKMEFVQYDDPEEFCEPDEEYGKHITATQEKLYDYILESVKASDVKPDDVIMLLADKREELFKVLNPEIDTYIEKIKVDYR